MSATPELEHVRGVWERVKDDSAIYRLVLANVEIISATRGQFQARLKLTADHVNSRGTIHGAVSAAIIDWAGGMSIATHGFEKTGASVDIHVTYLSTATVGETLDISAAADRVGKTMAFTTIKISKVIDGEVGPLVSKGSHTKFLPVSKEHQKPRVEGV
ncbi:Thioesterase superfamily [Penicillium brevicompactum]|uniref:Thioesterase superfamily n=1 Tax=Penicillium brevicompactum TaxID=5074 RepID=A0A9W9QTN2_PENBR|nr:Thioesterase superfamily [Penicillium brevicompactum]